MASPPGRGRRPDVSRAIAQYAARADRYDLELAAFEPVRTEALALLQVAPGAVVLDVACGTGLSFAGLVQRIGPRGRIVGIDPSPEMLAQARKRIARHGWHGIALVQADAASAPIALQADAALFHFTHDVLRDPAALDHVLAHLKPGAQVVAAGLQWAPAWLLPVNLFVLGAALYSVTSIGGLERPWDLLAQRLVDVQVRTRGCGGIYVLTGRLPAS